MVTHRISEATFHPERWLTPVENDSKADPCIGRPKTLKADRVVRWAMYFIRDQFYTQALNNKQLAPYLPRKGVPIKGNMLAVKVHELQRAENIEESETKEIQSSHVGSTNI